jgi:hypothetical protein
VTNKERRTRNPDQRSSSKTRTPTASHLKILYGDTDGVNDAERSYDIGNEDTKGRALITLRSRCARKRRKVEKLPGAQLEELGSVSFAALATHYTGCVRERAICR